MALDKQLRGVTLEGVVAKRRLGQALNAKEFAVLAGISYSAAREWFRLPGFPIFRGFVFWQDFADWRRAESGVREKSVGNVSPIPGESCISSRDLPPRAARILLEK